MSNKTGDIFLKDIFSRYLSNSLAILRISSSFEFLLMSKALPSTGAELVSQSFSLWSQKLLKSRLKKIKNAQWAYNKSSYKLAHIIKDLILYIEVLFWLFLSWFFPFTFLFLSLSFLFLSFFSFPFLFFSVLPFLILLWDYVLHTAQAKPCSRAPWHSTYYMSRLQCCSFPLSAFFPPKPLAAFESVTGSHHDLSYVCTCH